jgi:hypothetical protein
MPEAVLIPEPKASMWITHATITGGASISEFASTIVASWQTAAFMCLFVLLGSVLNFYCYLR